MRHRLHGVQRGGTEGPRAGHDRALHGHGGPGAGNGRDRPRADRDDPAHPARDLPRLGGDGLSAGLDNGQRHPAGHLRPSCPGRREDQPHRALLLRLRGPLQGRRPLAHNQRRGHARHVAQPERYAAHHLRGAARGRPRDDGHDLLAAHGHHAAHAAHLARDRRGGRLALPEVVQGAAVNVGQGQRHRRGGLRRAGGHSGLRPRRRLGGRVRREQRCALRERVEEPVSLGAHAACHVLRGQPRLRGRRGRGRGACRAGQHRRR